MLKLRRLCGLRHVARLAQLFGGREVFPVVGDAVRAVRAFERLRERRLVVEIRLDDLGAEFAQLRSLVTVRLARDGAGSKSARCVRKNGADEAAALRTGCADDGDDSRILHEVLHCGSRAVYPFVAFAIFRPMITVRRAEESDATAAIDVVRRSISQLCVADHHDDESTLTTWLANKTPQNFLAWIANTDNFCVVAESNSRLAGVGVLQRTGEILLFYLDPGAQRQGIGRIIHAALEAKAHEWQLAYCTSTARRWPPLL